MSTSDSSTPPFPKLERLLLDGDIDPEIAPYLEALGFDVEKAPYYNPDILQDDTQVLRYARDNRRIVFCHDKHRGKVLGRLLSAELVMRGGHILRISGSNQQPLFRILGKVLFHYDAWSTWFREHPEGGKIVLTDKKCTPTTVAKFKEGLTRITSKEQGGFSPPAPKASSRRRRPVEIAKEQQRLPLCLNDGLDELG